MRSELMKIARCLAAVTATLLLTGVPALSQDKKDPCANPQTQLEMNECQGKEYRKADAELNAVYKQLMSKLDDEGEKAALKNAQLAWIKFRDANCDFEAYLNKG